jgi:hypothetical protein
MCRAEESVARMRDWGERAWTSVGASIPPFALLLSVTVHVYIEMFWSIRIKRHSNLRRHFSSRRIRNFHNAIRARAVQLRPVDAEPQRPTTTLVPPRLPHGIDMSITVPRSRRRHLAVRAGGQPVRLHMARGKADGDDGLLRVDRLREEIVVQRDGALVLEHGCAGGWWIAGEESARWTIDMMRLGKLWNFSVERSVAGQVEPRGWLHSRAPG